MNRKTETLMHGLKFSGLPLTAFFGNQIETKVKVKAIPSDQGVVLPARGTGTLSPVGTVQLHPVTAAVVGMVATRGPQGLLATIRGTLPPELLAMVRIVRVETVTRSS